MPSTYHVALIGFTAFERSTFEAFFRLASRRSPCYVNTEHAAKADYVIVDADSAQAMADADARVAPSRCIFVGSRGRAGQLGQMQRPINMMVLLKLLDGCARAERAATRPAPLDEAPARKAAPVHAAAAEPVLSKLRPSSALQDPESELLVSRVDNILVVDDSDIALRFMANVLGRFGFDVQLAKSGEEALQKVAEGHFEFVFMDVTMPGIDGYQTCKLIKKRPYGAGRRAPSVVMLTSRGGMVDKMRGTLSGCDAYLTKPLQQGDLMKVIGERVAGDPRQAETKRMPLATTA